MRKTLFISDLHIYKGSPATHTFFHWLKTEAPGSDAVYILGDLFEVWIGDDDNSRFNQEVIAALRQLSDSGTPIYFIHGNRDFLISDRFANAAGMTLLPEHTVVDLYGTPTLIMHGDTLCTFDVRYQELRKTRPRYVKMSEEKPLWQKRLIVKLYRLHSYLRGKTQSEMIMDVAPDTVNTVMEEYGVQHLIHGHTHRPAVHHFTLNGKPATRTVLGAWEKRANMLVCTPEGQKLEFFEFI